MKLWLMVCALMAMAAGAQAQAMDRAQVEKIVAEYIAKHGDKVLQSMRNAEERERQDRLKALIKSHTPVSGPADAPVTVIEFSEFQCPFCGRVQPTLTELRKTYGTKVRWVFKNLPLEFHPQAKPAAYAAMAAQQQGKFWQYAKALWPHQKDLGDKLFTDTAKAVGLDMAKFEADRKSARIKAMVDADLKDAAEVGAQGTPYFIINGQPVSGALPTDAFRQAIDAALAKK